ncbi:MAG: conserved hypothetical protein, membrane [Candidatus Syntrophoarchaeum caldarius]|uniref:Uncharacterized protein n=1 Tax=Candidatus Syntropharchaeum caldarium TaxID=1838285 RepID=A0A1F2P9J0_9EURY|nr:MAG: conserved hypothetical protein, membrane [Candidatus Syntrophoarchaeum caldarius]
MNLKNIGLYSALIGGITAIIGVLEVIFVFTGTDSWIPADLFGGFALLVIAAVYLSGIGELLSKREEGLSFVLVGSILTGVFGILYILIMGADYLMYLLGEADEFLILDEVRPEILLLVAVLPVIVYFIRVRSYES